ncbi:hypothetical protein PoB_001959300 [Plakobranchus ocellatus]|uniref:Uncharacterized protein n=1 Tax=Plakobranchus ocellatus TaxID=259542 RepID=A0AAV3ZES6_9GAST|nr:hypothetical protein PoB_001959300 [Plakobranchus ocellatus]
MRVTRACRCKHNTVQEDVGGETRTEQDRSDRNQTQACLCIVCMYMYINIEFDHGCAANGRARYRCGALILPIVYRFVSSGVSIIKLTPGLLPPFAVG